MADWTVIPDTTFEPGAPAKGRDMRFLRDNPIAIAEGASGAPRIVNDAVTDGTLGSEKFQSGTDERDWVLARTAGASLGAVGTYAMARIRRDGDENLSPGSSVGGSSLLYAGINDNGITATAGTPTPSGSWRLMGYVRGVIGEGINDVVSIWLRIS